ncbi:tetratricopeptide repeat protein [uncultured Phenylobacterium sp.]|uniref:tetratricopeptide repeat protein n=1 Tax=uncultured Phenylobacterium sp. TaxID=349273 RepID=UPI0025EC0999|nr:tetratricopeptide repeat protein [uncultured Phenylobacterium sp.]
MTVTDIHGHVLSGASPQAAEHYQQALDAYHRYGGKPMKHLARALADSPGFVMAHLLKTYMTGVGTDPPTQAIGRAALADARGLPADSREQAHRAAAEALLGGRTRAAGRILEDIAVEHPRDLLALQAGQLVDFLTGDARMLRDRIARALPAWSEGMPNHHALLAMHAFGLEETGDYARAEAAGRRAIELEPRNGWAQHAVAHVCEMQDRRSDGVGWMRGNPCAWSDDSFFAIHNAWHLALFHLGLDEIDEVLALYDGPIYGERSTMPFDMDDAAALLWRLRLREIDVGDRWSILADAYAAQPRGQSAFDDVHAIIAFVGAGRDAEAGAALADMSTATLLTNDNAAVTRDIGLPVAQAMVAHGRGRHGEAVDLLREVRNGAARFGGSHAQRDLLDLTLIDAARRDGQTALERALLAEREAAKPVA